MKSIEGPLEANLLAPRVDSLERLAQEFHESSYQDLGPSEKMEVYNMGLREMEVSALSVVAQFCLRMANGA